MQIRPVSTPRDLRDFIELPYRLYRDDPIWAPPLRSEQRSQFDEKRNPFLDHCKKQLFLLEDEGEIIGRIAAFVDTLATEFWGERVGLFGYFECTESPAAAQLLLDAARDWLQANQCSTMRGPWSFVSQEWGLLVEGFVPSPVIMTPYNPSYYCDFMTDFGLCKVKDLLSWYVSFAEGYVLPERILTLTDAVAKRYGIRIRGINMRRYDQEVENIMELSNASIIDNWGYSPVTEAEVRAMARDMRPIVQPRGVLFAEDMSGRQIGFAIALPDINSLLGRLNGRLFPFGFLKLMWGIPRLRRYRMFGLGVIPEYQGKAVDSLLYRALHEKLNTPETWMEINYVLEDNWSMINAIAKLKAKPLRRYRVYEMEIGPSGIQ